MARAIAWIFIFLSLALAIAEWEGYLSPSSQQKTDTIVNKANSKSLALAIWDGTEKMKSKELSQILYGIAVVNSARRGRNLDVVFGHLLEYVPKELEAAAVDMELVRTEFGLQVFNGLGFFSHPDSYYRALQLADKFIGLKDLSTLLPPEHKDLACVDKVVFAHQRLGGVLGERLGVKEKDFPALHEKTRRLVHIDEDKNLFYCSK